WPRTDTPTPETYTLSLHDALPICRVERGHRARHRAGDGLLERGQVRHLGDQGGLVVERGAHRRQGARGDDVLGVLADQEAQEVECGGLVLGEGADRGVVAAEGGGADTVLTRQRGDPEVVLDQRTLAARVTEGGRPATHEQQVALGEGV